MRRVTGAGGVLLFCVLLCWSAGGPTVAAHAAAYPAKGIDLIVPFAPEAGTDLMGRVIAEALAKRWKFPSTS